MKINLSIIAIALAAFALVAAAPADAGKRHHRSSHGGYYDGYYSGGHYGHRRHRYARHYNHGYYRHSRHGYRHRDHSGAYLAGGLILGSALTHAFSRPRYSDRTVETVVYREPETRSGSTVVGRRLLKDRNGVCWERKLDKNGDELLEELPAQACDW